jgi:AcrR family transcriptional regulator
LGTTATRTRIVEGARAVFMELGIGDATVQHVLERANVSRRTFYQYFSGKEGVLAAVYEDWVEGLLGAIGAAVQQPGTPPERMIHALDAWLDHQQRHEPLSASLVMEAARPGSLLHDRREHTFDALVSTIDVWVTELLAVQVDPLLFRGLLLAVEGLIVHQAERGQLVPERSRLRRVVAGLFAGPLAHPAELPGPPR